MYRLLGEFRPSGLTVTGGLAMAIGALVYLNDRVPKQRNLHTFLWPALLLMAVGALLAGLGALQRRGSA